MSLTGQSCRGDIFLAEVSKGLEEGVAFSGPHEGSVWAGSGPAPRASASGVIEPLPLKGNFGLSEAGTHTNFCIEVWQALGGTWLKSPACLYPPASLWPP